MVLIGALIALTLELSGVPALPFAVGVYLPIEVSTPIFIGGLIRWVVDRVRKQSEVEAETSPAVLLSSGYIAGGALAGVLIAFMEFAPTIKDFFFQGEALKKYAETNPGSEWLIGDGPAHAAFGVLIIVLLLTGLGAIFRSRSPEGEPPNGAPGSLG
jgi:hypothetical protein